MSSTYRRPLTIRFWMTLAIATALALVGAIALQAPRGASAADVTAEVHLVSSTGTGLAGGRVSYHKSGWHLLGYTDSTGTVTGAVPSDATRLLMEYKQGSIATGTIDISQPYTFHTAKVTLLNTGGIYYTGGNGWAHFNSPMELLPDTYTFSNDLYLHNPFEITVPAEGFTGGVLRLVDHNGNGLAGGTASVYLGGWHGIAGQTDNYGNLVFSVPNDSSYLAIRMVYEGTSNQQSRTELQASNFTFQTAGVTVQLQDADGNPLDPGAVSYYAGGWRTFGSGTTVNGAVSQEMLSGNYAFKMIYNHTGEQRNGVAITTPTTTITFQTGRLTLNYSESINWANSQWYGFTKPTMEFLPGTYTFSFSGCNVEIPIAAGDHLVKSAIVATLSDSAGHPLADGVATAYVRGWKSIGTTNSQGKTCQVFDGALGNTTVRMTYAGTSQTMSQSQPANSVYAFKTTLVTVELKNSAGSLIDTGNASYYAAGWHAIGDTSGGQVSLQMLPGSYAFAMVYEGTRQQLNGVAISGPSTTVDFQTTVVTVQLVDHSGNLIDTGSASYYARGWHTIGDTSGGQVTVEMLPGSYAFAMTYLGTREQQNGVAINGGTTTVTFQTGLVHSDSGSATSYYAGGWRTFTNDMELLSGSYTFHFNGGTANTKYALNGGTENHIH